MVKYAVIFRVVDANLNRATEGLRVLEEMARMVLNNGALSLKIKNLRHSLAVTAPSFNSELLGGRDAAGDVGANITVSGQGSNDFVGLIIANSKRTREALRVLEELSKMSEVSSSLLTETFRDARFTLYDIEKKLYADITRIEKIKLLSGLYAVVDTGMLQAYDCNQLALLLIDGGVKVIQLRAKELTRKEVYPIACSLKELCREKEVLFIINDYLDVALAVGADGLHIGQADLPASEARRLLPLNSILGVSVRTTEEALAAEKDGADYLGCGAVFATTTKQDASVIGLEGISNIRAVTKLPLVAIGGINESNLTATMNAGADSVCIISAIVKDAAPKEATRRIINIIKKPARRRSAMLWPPGQELLR